MTESHKFSRRTALGFGLAAAASGTILAGPAAAASGAGRHGHGHGGGRPIVTAAFTPDTTTVLRNPLDGWSLYANTSFPADYWTQYDAVPVEGSTATAKVSDYASVYYLRVAWSLLEPSEGVYAWQSDTPIKRAMDEARARGLRLAFRVVVDSRDKAYDFTPDYVRAAGAQGYETQTGSKTVWSPYPDDPVFQEKFAAFLQAFGAEYGDPAVTDYVDGYGLGKWGEGHTVLYLDATNRESVFRWIVGQYSAAFPKVVLAMNYHRMIGTGEGWGTPDPDSERLLDIAFDSGYVLRHDAFGMTTYYGDWEKAIAAKWKYQRPIIMEGGWVTGSMNYSVDPRGYTTVADVRQGEYDDSAEAHVNMMDFRVGECLTWFADAYPLVQQFDGGGGYRLYPTQVVAPTIVSAAGTAEFTHTWANLGWGYLPNNIPAWNQRYKVAIALLTADGTAVKVLVDANSDPSTWLNGRTTSYTFTSRGLGVAKGAYRWGVAVVDTTKGNTPGIALAAQGATTNGWLVVGDVQVV
ncbi:MAG: DUF4832 domain-containing protein [Actinomycetia bacterium]|nr:DUF4832 domain-containing protein [Actinomycetes bacterium]